MNLNRSLAVIPKKTNFYFLTIGAVPTIALPIDPGPSSFAAGALFRSSVTFHNPGAVGASSIYFTPASDHNGNPVTPSIGTGFLLDPGTSWTIDAPGPVGWNAIALANTPMTILEYLS